MILLLPSPLPVNKLSLYLSLPVCRQSSLVTGEGDGGGEEPNYSTARKPGPIWIIQYPLQKCPPRQLMTVRICKLAYTSLGQGKGGLSQCKNLVIGPWSQGVTKRCGLPWLTNSTLVYEPKCGGGKSCGVSARSQALSQWVRLYVHRSPNKLWRNLCMKLRIAFLDYSTISNKKEKYTEKRAVKNTKKNLKKKFHRTKGREEGRLIFVQVAISC